MGRSSSTAKPGKAKAKAPSTSDGKTKRKEKQKTPKETSPNPLRGTDDFKLFEVSKDLQKQLKQRKKAADGDFPVNDEDNALIERAKKARVEYTKALCRAKGVKFDASKLYSPPQEEKKESTGVGNTLTKDDPWADVSSGPSTPTKPRRTRKKKSSKKSKGEGTDESPV